MNLIPMKKRKKRRVIKKYSVTWWHKRLDDKIRVLFRETYNSCAMCGNPNIQLHHIYSKGAHQALRYDVINLLPLCGRCHRFKWHDDIGPAWEWFKEKYPKRYAYLQEAKKLFIKRNQKYYEKIDKALDERNIKDLMILPIDRDKNT